MGHARTASSNARHLERGTPIMQSIKGDKKSLPINRFAFLSDHVLLDHPERSTYLIRISILIHLLLAKIVYSVDGE
jgi:hypothetical protein